MIDGINIVPNRAEGNQTYILDDLYSLMYRYKEYLDRLGNQIAYGNQVKEIIDKFLYATILMDTRRNQSSNDVSYPECLFKYFIAERTWDRLNVSCKDKDLDEQYFQMC